MPASSGVRDRNARPLGDNDVERVIAIDGAHSGHARRHFFEKRFAALKARPGDYIHVGAMWGGSLRGFAIARILRGEFGHEHPIAVLDAIGVDPQTQDHGIGEALMKELCEAMWRNGVRSLHSQAEWTKHHLLRFFEASGFRLAPRLALERSVSELLDEPSEEI
jgi:ribosomal protein S18 acetylase RimI-like enzyme